MSKELRVPLEIDTNRYQHGRIIVKCCRPFIMNSRGILIHRPRMITMINTYRYGPHFGITFHCGMTSVGMKRFTFMNDVPADRVLCASCEAKAILKGLPSADAMVGHHIHVGGLKTQITCCEMDAVWTRKNTPLHRDCGLTS